MLKYFILYILSVSYLSFQIYTLARETIVLLLEGNPDIGTLLDWIVDRCYTGAPQVADGCFLALATIFSARYVQIKKYRMNISCKNVYYRRVVRENTTYTQRIKATKQNHRYRDRIIKLIHNTTKS